MMSVVLSNLAIDCIMKRKTEGPTGRIIWIIVSSLEDVDFVDDVTL